MPDHADYGHGFPLPRGNFGNEMAEVHMHRQTRPPSPVLGHKRTLYRNRLGAPCYAFESQRGKLAVFKVIGGDWADESDNLLFENQRMGALERLALVELLDDPSTYTGI